ncbi:MAG: low molecular weight protein-tyrosine-phosphatase [Trueperaceae bacterium]
MRHDGGRRAAGHGGVGAATAAPSDAAWTGAWARKPDAADMHEHAFAASTVSVLFVCMGNICRSPTAEGVFRRKVREAGLEDRVIVDSAGTHGYHVGAPPDARAQETAARRGYDLSRLRGRMFDADDCQRFDYVLAMDRGNYNRIVQTCRSGGGHRGHGAGTGHGRGDHEAGQGAPARDGTANVRMFLEFAPYLREREVPDPYAGSDDGFEYVLDLIEAAADGLLEDVRQRLAGE